MTFRILAFALCALSMSAAALASTPEDVARGRAIFTGEQPLANGGKPCIACHQVRDAGMPQGGLRAPDLTHIGDLDEALLRGALSKQRFMMMDAAFASKPVTDDEKRAVVAFLTDVAERNAETDEGTPAMPLLAVAAGIVLPLGALALVRSRRRRRAAAA